MVDYPISTTFVDSNGNHLLISPNVRAVISVDLTGTTFYSPDAYYEGYAFNGNYYSSGSVVPGHARASWATESRSAHRGVANSMPKRFFALLTDRELSVIDAEDLTLFMRFLVQDALPIGPEVPGIFLEWVPDESFSNLGTALGVYGMTFSAVRWANGRLVVASNNGLRVFDFKADSILALKSSGCFRYRTALRSTLIWRNVPDFYGPVVDPTLVGLTNTVALANFTSGIDCFATAGGEKDVVVLRWHEPPGSATVLETCVTEIEPPATAGFVRSLFIYPTTGELFILYFYYATPLTAQLRVMRSAGEWHASPLTPFSGSLMRSSLPDWVGTVGDMTVVGEYIYVGAGSGIWRAGKEDLALFTLLYGKTLNSSEPVAPLYTVLSQDGFPIVAIGFDPATGFIGVLHGQRLSTIDMGKNMAGPEYVAISSSDPEIPADPCALASFSFDAAAEV
jgi:hypothetical protein